MALLDAISCPADLRKLSMSELTELAAEMRDVIFVSMLSFLGILFVGYIYALKKRAFDWKS